MPPRRHRQTRRIQPEQMDLFQGSDANTSLRLCRTCKQYKPRSEFTYRKDSRDRLQYSCRDCNSEKAKRYAGTRDERKMMKLYGITVEEYEQMHLAQQGLCAICGLPETGEYLRKPLKLAVDHDHQTGKIRGLLCVRCNRALGYFNEDIKRLEHAIAYLKLHNEADYRSESSQEATDKSITISDRQDYGSG